MGQRESRRRSWEANTFIQGRDNVGSNGMAAVEMVRSAQILEIREGDSTGFADELGEECERKRRIKNRFQVLYLEQPKNCDCCHLKKGRGVCVSPFITPLSASSHQYPFFTFLILLDFHISYSGKKSKL